MPQHADMWYDSKRRALNVKLSLTPTSNINVFTISGATGEPSVMCWGAWCWTAGNSEWHSMTATDAVECFHGLASCLMLSELQKFIAVLSENQLNALCGRNTWHHLWCYIWSWLQLSIINCTVHLIFATVAPSAIPIIFNVRSGGLLARIRIGTQQSTKCELQCRSAILIIYLSRRIGSCMLVVRELLTSQTDHWAQ